MPIPPIDNAPYSREPPVNNATSSQRRTMESGSLKHTRAGKPKSKSGCRTCKVRRVKCDETRPSCLQCLKVGQDCVGYPVGRKPPPTWSPPMLLPKLAPEQTSKTESNLAVTMTVNVSNIPRSLQAKMFTSDSECRYFQLFCGKTASRLGGYFNPLLFDHSILQFCEHNDSIKSVAIAIGALDSSLEIGLEPKSDEEQRSRETHHRSALQYYGKAIKIIRESISTGQLDMTNALISCLLCVCFECFNGNSSLAISQARSGMKLFNSWLSETRRRQVNDGYSSSAPDVIEDGLIRAFVKLDVDSLSLVDATPMPMNLTTRPKSFDIINQMPTEFSDLQEAAAHWDILIRHMMHFTHNLYWMAPLDGTGFEKSVFEAVTRGQEKATQERLAKMYEDFNNYKEAFSKWNAGFRPLFRKHQDSPSSVEFIAAIDLQIRFLACSTPFFGSFANEVKSDQSLSVHKEILHLVEEIINNTKEEGKASFLFYGPVIGSLYSVGLKCRDPATRRKSILLLKANPRREGLWDSASIARIMEIQMEIEERGIVDGFIPEESRMKIIRASFNLQERSGLLRYRMSGLNHPTEHVKFTW